MTWADYADILVRVVGLSLAAGAIAQLVKYPVQVLLVVTARYPEHPGRARSLWVGSIRFGAALSGLTLGRLDVWPEWMQPAWGPLLGAVAGVSSAAVYDAWIRIVGGSPAALLSILRARFGAAPEPEQSALGVSETGTVEVE